MNDLTERLSALRTDTAPTLPEAVAADLQRGRRANNRRRLVRGGSTAAFALVVGAATTAVITSAPAPSSPDARLVDYTGTQLPGFTVAKVPAGFVLQGATAYSLDIARADDTTSLDDFRGKIVVSVEAADESAGSAGSPASVRVERTGNGIRVHCPDGATKMVSKKDGRRTVFDAGTICGVVTPRDETPTPASGPIDVDGAAGTVSTNGEGATYFRETVGDRTVVVQVWPTLHLSEAQIRELADGLTVTAAAQVSRG